MKIIPKFITDTLSVDKIREKFEKIIDFIDGIDEDAKQGNKIKVILKCMGMMTMLGAVILSFALPIWLFVVNKDWISKIIVLVVIVVILYLYVQFMIYLYRRFLQ